MKKLMCRFDTTRHGWIATVALILMGSTAHAQTYEFALNWRAIGTTVVDNSRAGVSGGPVSGLWFSPQGDRLEVQLTSGRQFATTDFESWAPIATPGTRALATWAVVDSLPEPNARPVASPSNAYRVYAAGQWLYRSDDSGRHWTNLITDGNVQLIGKNVRGITISPLDPDRIAVATDEGIWLSIDGGSTWNSLNSGLPNLRLPRLLAAPAGGRGLRAQWENGAVIEWLPGSKSSWMSTTEPAPTRDPLRWAESDARLEVRTTDRAHVYRSLNGGLQWDDLTSDLAAQQIFGIAADRASGAIYVATERGVFYTLNNLETATAPTSWIRLGGNLPREAALDVLLNPGGNFLYASLAGEGVFLTYAPHRRRTPALISAADLQTRAAAPGGLMSVVGMKLTQAQLAGQSLPILSANADETQVQIPYEASLTTGSLELSTGRNTLRLDLDIAPTAPVIFTDRDGAPLLLDADSGELLDPAQPLRAGTRVQILLTGLGRVEPAWPAGVAAPAQNSPRVVAPVRVWLNDQTLEVSKSELAGGYVGFYAVETKLPPVVDNGFAEIRVEAAGRFSNTIRVRVTL